MLVRKEEEEEEEDDTVDMAAGFIIDCVCCTNTVSPLSITSRASSAPHNRLGCE